MTYNEAIAYIHSLLKFGIHPGLSRMDSLLKELGEPQKDLKFIHIAGTNGKGSVSTAMANILIESGFNIGLYTSPYVTDFLERIQYNGEFVSRELFSTAVEDVKLSVEKLNKEGTLITEFEALTAAAFLCFNRLSCDVVVLEVGLGGRLDATNVIDRPLVNIITSLSLDHTAVLGDTIEKIAFEKCGTLKRGGSAVVSYNQCEGAFNTVKDIAAKMHNTLIIPDKSAVSVIKSDITGTEFLYKGEKYSVKMPGLHQVVNMTSCIEAVNVLNDKGYHISESAVKNGILKTVLPARCEVISKTPLVILDGGHNDDGAKAFYDLLSKSVFGKKVTVIGGMMKDKAVEASLKPLMSFANEFYSVTPNNPRSMSAEELSEIAKKYCKKVFTAASPEAAVKKAVSELENEGVLCVVGSLYLAGEIRKVLIEECNRRNFS